MYVLNLLLDEWKVWSRAASSACGSLGDDEDVEEEKEDDDAPPRLPWSLKEYEGEHVSTTAKMNVTARRSRCLPLVGECIL